MIKWKITWITRSSMPLQGSAKRHCLHKLNFNLTSCLCLFFEVWRMFFRMILTLESHEPIHESLWNKLFSRFFLILVFTLLQVTLDAHCPKLGQFSYLASLMRFLSSHKDQNKRFRNIRLARLLSHVKASNPNFLETQSRAISSNLLIAIAYIRRV